MSASGIESLNDDIFAQLPELQVLDLSKNYLIEFKVDIIKPLPMLNTLNLKNNSFECNYILPSWMVKLNNYAAENDIRQYETCSVSIQSEKFQRMVAVENEPFQKNGWLYDEEIETIENRTEIRCNKTIPANEVRNIISRHLMNIIELSPLLFVLFLLVFGFAVGKQKKITL